MTREIDSKMSMDIPGGDAETLHNGARAASSSREPDDEPNLFAPPPMPPKRLAPFPGM
jgi:hypothetical protein